MKYFELSPAYGRDYKTSKEAKEAWVAGKDWEGDYQLGFRLVNSADMVDQLPYCVNLRYKGGTKIAQIKVDAKGNVMGPLHGARFND